MNVYDIISCFNISFISPNLPSAIQRLFQDSEPSAQEPPPPEVRNIQVTQVDIVEISQEYV